MVSGEISKAITIIIIILAANDGSDRSVVVAVEMVAAHFEAEEMGSRNRFGLALPFHGAILSACHHSWHSEHIYNVDHMSLPAHFDRKVGVDRCNLFLILSCAPTDGLA